MHLEPDGKPMMSDADILAIERIIAQRQPKVCLEWGSGNSTLHFPNSDTCIRSWVAVEHDGAYVQAIAGKVDAKKVTLIWAADIPGIPNQHYIDCVKHNVGQYDLILIDGIQRKECLDAAWRMLAYDGVIILHDSGRAEYREWIKYFVSELPCEYSVLTTGDTPDKDGFARNGVTVFTKS